MELSEAERREFAIDELLAGSLPHEGTDRIIVRAQDAELALLRADHTARWRIVTGPITLSIIAILELGPFHLAWSLCEDEPTPIRPQLRQGVALPITLTSRTQGTLQLTAPPFPASLRPLLDTAYLPISAA
ncbi:MAG: hypothetical protein HGA45_38425 [Chloroflexales bacterium]|nr:hypothetical protein [Chloroflexales bacterium]